MDKKLNEQIILTDFFWIYVLSPEIGFEKILKTTHSIDNGVNSDTLTRRFAFINYSAQTTRIRKNIKYIAYINKL